MPRIDSWPEVSNTVMKIPPWFQIRVLVLSIVVISLSGCGLKQWKANGFKVGPNYCKPVAEVAPDWIDATDERISTGPTDASYWWLVFDDPILNALVMEAYDQNLTLREAGMRVLEAQARLVSERPFPRWGPRRSRVLSSLHIPAGDQPSSVTGMGKRSR